MTLRDLKLPQDLEELAPMIADSFQYPENPAWGVQDDERESLVEDINSLRRSWWIIKIGQVFLPAMRDLLTGKVWEEDGRIAAVVLVQPRGSSDQWVVGTVATRLEYRRRGLARKLVSANLDFLKEKKARTAILDVIDANLPAYELYKSLGFEHYGGDLDLELAPGQVVPAVDFPEGYTLESAGLFNWQARYDLLARISPDELQRYEPVEEALFRQPGYWRALLPILVRVQKIRPGFAVARHMASGQVAGYVRWDAKLNGKGRHSLGARVDPDHALLAGPLLAHALHEMTSIDPGLVCEMGVPTWQQAVLDAADALGFTRRLLYHRLGIRF